MIKLFLMLRSHRNLFFRTLILYRATLLTVI